MTLLAGKRNRLKHDGILRSRLWLHPVSHAHFGPRPDALLIAHETRDRTQVFGDGRPIGVLERETGDEAIEEARTLTIEKVNLASISAETA